MNLAGYDFKKYLKVFDVSDFTQFSFNGFTYITLQSKALKLPT